VRSRPMLLWAAAPLLVIALIFIAVLRSGAPAPFPRAQLPREAHRPDVCTWSCHNHGCRHEPRLPAWLSGDRGLFGIAIRALYRMGGVLLPGRPREGYGLANLLVFCLVWPGLMWGLYLVAVAQARELRGLRRKGQGSG
jgi:hypothetical protein